MRRLSALLVVLLFAVGAPSLRTQQQQPLRIHFVDVGQGDGVLIQSPLGPNVVYDGGENPTRMREYLQAVGVSRVGVVIGLPSHKDERCERSSSRRFAGQDVITRDVVSPVPVVD